MFFSIEKFMEEEKLQSVILNNPNGTKVAQLFYEIFKKFETTNLYLGTIQLCEKKYMSIKQKFDTAIGTHHNVFSKKTKNEKDPRCK